MRKNRSFIFIICAFIGALFLSACQNKNSLSAAQIAVLKQQGFKQTDEGWLFGMSEKVLFGNNQSHLRPEGEVKLKELANVLTKAGIHHARLDGHTDNYGEVGYNNQLSLKRANTVADALTQGGMQRRGLTTRGLGPSQPIADNKSSKGRAENRRVAIVITAP
ncbi:OmpA family protein [Xenorhabdus sp. 42]|uniref:OmpA family protein n=1 Tax=Xenorhabdus szentirmaii TaxID=290112 RepID=A0AAW3YP04_9GAMM|nr:MULTISPECIES: OmpA family protein [Xenorhabdus]MBD2793034.1 OmpA family protein [Xenorhabdus sp. CUL]MBD2799287.1 OmpA family protein [Xenorhabdus sp. M]MBD2804224.1 OmpA family protein [Xenorhabdus sp. ZM]MBD2820799.1 OmpA family protein [Xenorhabdus sp. 42]MBD2824493.1 OmpA family protein [Xenorhabdus sp. 5]